MADTDIRLNFDDGGMGQALAELAAQSERFASAMEDLDRTGKQAFRDDTVKQYAGEVNKAATAMDAANKATEAQARGVAEARREMAQYANSVNILGVNVGQTIARLQGMAGAIKATTVGVGGLSKAFRVLKVAIASTGIGLLVVALGGLAAMLTKTQSGMNAVGKVMAQLGNIFDVLIDRSITFADGLLRIIRGDFRGGVERLKESYQGLGQALRDTARAARELFDLQRTIYAVETAQIQARAKLNAELNKERLIVQDTTKSYGERIKAAERTLEINSQLGAQAVQLAELQLEAIRREEEENKKQGLFTDEAVRRIIEAEAAVADARAAADLERIRLQNNYLRLIREEEAARLNAVAAQEELLRSIERYTMQQQGLGELLNLQDLVAQTEEYIATLRELNGEGAYSGQIKALEEILAKQREQIENLGRIKVEIEELALPEDDFNAAEWTEAAISEWEAYLDEQQRLAQEARQNIINQWRGMGRDIMQIGQNLGQVFASITGPQLEAQQQVVASLSDSTSALEKELEEQRRLQAQGYANNVRQLEARLRQEEAALAAAERRKLEIQRRAAREQALIDSAQAASQLALAVAKMLASQAGNPIGLIAAATAGIAALFGLYRSGRALASEAALPMYREGGPVEGPPHERGGVVAELEGGEYVMSKMAVDRHGDLIRAINDDRLAGYLPALVDAGERYRPPSAGAPWQEAISKQTADLIAYWKSRPVDRDLERRILREWTEGNTTYRKTFTPKK